MDFNKIINDNKNNIKKIIYAITGEENEDLEQEVSVKIWQNADKYTEKGYSKSWISKIVKNTSIAVSNDAWDNIKNKYNTRKEDYKYIEEPKKEIEKETLEDKKNDIEKIFDDIIEYS